MSKKGNTQEDDGMRGSMVINDGQIESSTGSLAGQDHLAQIFQRLLQSGCAEEVLSTGERFKTVTIAFPSHYYTITRRAAKIYVARLAHNSASAEMFVCSSSNTVSENTQAAEQATQADNDEEKPKEDEKAHDSDDNESVSSSSSSIATVKSEQNSDSDNDEASDVKEEPKNESTVLRSDSPVEPPSIESSIQQQQKDLN